MPRIQGIWLPDHDDTMRACFALGMSCTEAACAINNKHGTDYSRNAVIGRAMRKGIQTANPSHGAVRSPKGAKKPWVEQGIHKRTYYRRKAAVARPAKPRIIFKCDEARLDDVVPLNISIYELTDNTCRWPYGDGSETHPYVFCGLTPFECGPYCAAHMGLAMRPWVDQRRAA